MKQTDPEMLARAATLLEELKIKRGGAVLEFHRQMANDPAILQGFSHMYDMANTEMKHIPRKYAELIVYAVGCAINAPTTIDVHSKLALKYGATIDELGEALRIVFFLCGVGGLTPGLKPFEALEETK